MKDPQFEAIREALREELGIEKSTYELDRESFLEVVSARISGESHSAKGSEKCISEEE
jgi:hypothetical protein